MSRLRKCCLDRSSVDYGVSSNRCRDRYPQDVTVDADMRELYRQRFQAWQAEIGAYCAGRGIHFAPTETSTPWEQLILSELRRTGVVH